MKARHAHTVILTLIVTVAFLATTAWAALDDENTRNVLKQGLLGAGTGAIAAGTSGGNAGTGALVGAGTGVIGSVLLDAITTPSQPRQSAPVYRQSAPAPVYRQSAPPPQADDYYYEDQGDEYYYEEPPQESGSSKILKQGLLGAGTGAIAAGASGGKAGQGALIGAGTGVIGSVLLDAMTTPSQPRRVYRRAPVQRVQQPQQVAPRMTTVPQQQTVVQEESAGPEGGRKKIIKKYDENGKLVSEEEVYY